jgi:hypothetical protein
MEINMKSVKGNRVYAYFLAVFDEKQKIIGDALKLTPPIAIDMQKVGERLSMQIWVPQEDGIGIHISNPHIVGVALLDQRKHFLAGLPIKGDPAMREADSLFILYSRYIIMQPKGAPK